MTETFRGERTLMRVFIGESDKFHGKPGSGSFLKRATYAGT